jgi:hypothetical protein
MGLRLLRWWHRDPVPAGRHVRVLPVVGVPGAAATIVSSASLDPLVTGAAVPAAPPGGPALTWPAPADPPAHVATEGRAPVLPAPGPDGRHDGVATESPGSDATPWDAPVAAVGLVFADGASVELEADDPRVSTFRAAAAALLDPPSV